MKRKLLVLVFFTICATGFSQYTAIPDANFDQALIDLGIDTNTTLDHQILTSEINTIITLDVSNKNIADLTGIENFTNLSSLNCSFNLLTSVNVIQNTNLIYLYCNDNLLTYINLSQNQYLADFYCQNNQMEALGLHYNHGLFQFKCNNNQLKVLNIKSSNNNYSSPSFGPFTINTLNNPDLECILI